MKNIKQKGILFLKREKLDLFVEDKPAIISFTFPPSTIVDLEVVNKDLLKSEIATFLKNNSINPSFIILVFSDDMVFQKEFKGIKSTQVEQDIQTFLGSVPFENISSKLYTSEAGYKVIVINKDLFLSLKEVFENQGFKLDGAIPASSIEANYGAKSSLDLPMCQYIIQRFDSIKQSGIEAEEEIPSEKETKKQEETKKIQKTHLKTVFAGVFVFITVVILLIVIKKTLLP